MRGRFFGVIAGVVLVGEGALLWRPQLLGAMPTPDLGPFTQYRLWVAGLAAAVGAAVMLASLRRKAVRAVRISPAGRTFEWTVTEAVPAPARAAPPVVRRPPPSRPEGQAVAAPAPVPPPAAPALDEAPEPEPTPAVVDSAQPTFHPAPGPEPEPVLAPEDPELMEELAPFPALPAEVEAVEHSGPAPAPSATGPADTPPPAPAPKPMGARLGFLALTEHGHQLRAAGQLEDALEPYGEALAIARKRAADESDPWAKRDLASALTNLADVHDRDGRIDSAIALHEESLGLRRALAAASPGDIAAQRSLSLGLERLADARDARGHRSRARDLFRERLVLAERLAALRPHDAALTSDVASTRERLNELDEALAL